MWHVLAAFLTATCIQAHQPSPSAGASLYSSLLSASITDRAKLSNSYQSYSGQSSYFGSPKYSDSVSVSPIYGYGSSRNTQSADEAFAPRQSQSAASYYQRSSDSSLRQPSSSSSASSSRSSNVYQSELSESSPSSRNGVWDNNYGTYSEPERDATDSSSTWDQQSYYDDLELAENFGKYLRKRTQIDPFGSITDAAHQYNALLAVIVALARIIRNSCADFDQVYDQIYGPTVDTYYAYGLSNADKVSLMIEDYIAKGASHLPKLRKIKQDVCEKELFCAPSVNNKIRGNSIVYEKELGTLESITNLARSFYPYIDEFNSVSSKGIVIHYLQKSKERLRDYIMHVVNSVDHLSDKPVKCL